MRFRPPRVVVALLACLLVIPTAAAPVLAWNFVGHTTVALIAYRQLDEAERQEVAAILKAHPHYKRLLLPGRPGDVDEGQWAFLRASVWPDLVRPSDPRDGDTFRGPEITRYHRGGWHVIQLPWVPPGDRATFGPVTRPAADGEHALKAIPLNVGLLSAPDSTPHDRAVALAWLEHLIGDIHQPLHACTLFSPQYPQGDNDGSGRTIRTPGGEALRLHVYWDRQLGVTDAFAAYDFLARSISADPRHAPEMLARISRGDTAQDWALESYDLAVAFAHLNGRLVGMPTDEQVRNKTPAEQIPPLPMGYAENARRVAEERVAQAGLRLAATIRSALRAAREAKPTTTPRGGPRHATRMAVNDRRRIAI